jgi:hypothetical protein
MLLRVASARLRPAADVVEEPTTVGLERALAQLVSSPVRYPRSEPARRCLEAVLEYCEEHGLEAGRPYLRACRARMVRERARAPLADTDTLAL